MRSFRDEDPHDTDTISSRYGKRMLAIAWIAGFILLFLFFQDSLKEIYNPNPTPASKTLGDGSTQVTLLRNRYGHYVASGSINGKKVNFLVDTGASDVSIPASVANRLNLIRGKPFYAHTANGTIKIYRTHLNRVTLGNIHLENLNGSINPNMESDNILLGMEFLKRLDFSQSGNKLTLTKR